MFFPKTLEYIRRVILSVNCVSGWFGCQAAFERCCLTGRNVSNFRQIYFSDVKRWFKCRNISLPRSLTHNYQMAPFLLLIIEYLRECPYSLLYDLCFFPCQVWDGIQCAVNTVTDILEIVENSFQTKSWINGSQPFVMRSIICKGYALLSNTYIGWISSFIRLDVWKGNIYVVLYTDVLYCYHNWQREFLRNNSTHRELERWN